MKDTAIMVKEWAWHPGFTASIVWTTAMVSSAVGKYHYSIDGAGNIFAALCAFYAFIGLVLLFVTPDSVLKGKPKLLHFFDRAVLFALMGTTVWFGNWWLFTALFTFLVGSGVHRQQAEKRYAAQQVA